MEWVGSPACCAAPLPSGVFRLAQPVHRQRPCLSLCTRQPLRCPAPAALERAGWLLFGYLLFHVSFHAPGSTDLSGPPSAWPPASP